MLRFQCPGCKSVLQVAATLAGGAVACSRCGQRLRIPAAPASQATAQARPAPPPSPLPVRKNEDEDDRPRPRRRPQRQGGVGLVTVGLIVAGVMLAGLAGVSALVVMSQPNRPTEEKTATNDNAKPPNKDGSAPVKPLKDGAAKQDGSANKDGTPKKEGDAKPRPTEEKSDEKDPKKRLLALINTRREELGVPPLTLDADHSRGCDEHAAYLLTNRRDHPDLDPHAQEDLPGASKEGKAAACAASVIRKPPAEAIGALLAAQGHRAVLLDPALKSVGIGFAGEEKREAITVLDLQRGGPGAGDPSGAVLYPAPRQTDVPLAFPGNEIPDPLPDTKDKLTGFPVTATFPARLSVTDASARLEDEEGREVPVWFSSPERPANADHARLQQNTLCLFAKSRLSPGTRYVVHLRAKVGGKDWSRAWSFTTIGPAKADLLMYRRAIDRFNEVRNLAKLKPVRIDADKSKACRAHAAYLARHLDRSPGVRIDEEDPDLAGYTPEGQEVGKRAALRIGGGNGPADAVDWMMASVLNRHLVLNPSLETVGFGAAQQSPRGWLWVVSLSPQWQRIKGNVATMYPPDGMKDVPLYYGREVREVVPGAAKGHVAGFAVTANFFPAAKVTRARAALFDPDGNEVDCWLSTPEKPLANTGTYKQILLIPKKALAAATKYSAAMSAEADGEPWSAEWSFRTMDPKAKEAAAAKTLCEAVNRARVSAGLEPVVLEEKQSVGCRLHAKYVVRNLDHPKVAGLGIHEEDMSLPDATAEGARAGKSSVIAIISDPLDSVDGWLATIYHRIPLMARDLKRIGYGQELHPTRGWVTVMDASGR